MPLLLCEKSKIEKVARGIQENPEKTRQVRENWSQKIDEYASPKTRTEPGVRKAKRSLLACHIGCKCSMETSRTSVNVKLGIKVMNLVEILIALEVVVTGQSQNIIYHSWEGYFILLHLNPVSIIEFPEWWL